LRHYDNTYKDFTLTTLLIAEFTNNWFDLQMTTYNSKKVNKKLATWITGEDVLFLQVESLLVKPL